MNFKEWLQCDESLGKVGKWIANNGLPIAIQAYGAIVDPVSQGMQKSQVTTAIVAPGSDEFMGDEQQRRSRKGLQNGKPRQTRQSVRPGSIHL